MGDVKMNLTEDVIMDLVKKYDDCSIEEIFENDISNWCVITCDLEDEIIDGEEWQFGGIFDLLDELEKYDNIVNVEDETISNDDGDGYFEYVSIEWK